MNNLINKFFFIIIILVIICVCRDWTTTFAPTGTIGAAAAAGKVFAVSLTIPWDNRVASRSSQTAVFAFSTRTALPAGGSNSITITFPLNFFVSNTASSCGITESISANGIPGFSFSGTGPSSTTTFVLSASAALPAGSYAVTFSGVTFGAATAGSDTGITVQTSVGGVVVDAVSDAAPSGPLSGYQVLAFTLPTCLASLDQTCQSATLTFLSNAAPIPAAAALTISFSSPAPNPTPISGTVEQFVTPSGAVVAGAVSGASRRQRLTSAQPAVLSALSDCFCELRVIVTSSHCPERHLDIRQRAHHHCAEGNHHQSHRAINCISDRSVQCSGVRFFHICVIFLALQQQPLHRSLTQPRRSFVRLASGTLTNPSTDLDSKIFYPTSFGRTVTTLVNISSPYIGAQNTQVRSRHTLSPPSLSLPSAAWRFTLCLVGHNFVLDNEPSYRRPSDPRRVSKFSVRDASFFAGLPV
jgi:hypothetical protein